MWKPIVKGICVAALLAAIGWWVDDWQWWVGCIGLNVAVNL